MKTQITLVTLSLLSLLAVVIIGCTNFSANLFRTEQTTTGTAFTAYVGYTNGLQNGTIKVSNDESNQIKQARIKFAASVLTVEGWRQAYETNAAVKPQAQAALTALVDDGGNLINLINLVRSK